MSQVSINGAFVGVDDVRAPPEFRALLEAVCDPGGDLCFIEVRRGSLRYTLALSTTWVEFAKSVDAIGDGVTDMELPRAAIRAVLEGWRDDWADGASTLLDRSPDDVPFISLR